MNGNLGLSPLWGPRPCLADDGVHFASRSIRGLHDALQAFGHDASSILARQGVDANTVDEWFPVEAVDTLLRAAIAATGDAALGLRWGTHSPVVNSDLPASSLAGAATLRDALGTVVQAQFMFVNRAHCFFFEEGRCSVVSLDLPSLSEVGNRLITELMLASLYRCFHYVGHQRAIRHINVGYPRPAYGDAYDGVFGAKLCFDRPRSSIEFASEALDRLSGAYSAALNRMIRGPRRRAQPAALRPEQVEALVRATLPPVPNVVRVAQELGVSLESLRRCLSSAQTSFSQLVDRVRRERALELFVHGAMSVKDVAHATGFRSVSGFQRAYRRWTGTSPSRKPADPARSDQ